MEKRQEITKNIYRNNEKIFFNNIDQSCNLSIGMILNEKYEIRREIARGGMGIVYEAYCTYINKKVAIKIMLNTIDSLQFKRFQKEIEACSRLLHPNVVSLYDAGICNNNPYIVMEYIDGVNISQYITQQDKAFGQEDNTEQAERDWKLCARLIYETALGLEYIHNQNMFHRDIKPSNILVRPNGSPVIIDFGLVKFNQERSYNLTRSRDIIGTCQYMPIEQIQGKRGKIDARSDVYSLGLVLYELLTEKRAYNGKNVTDVFNKIVSYYPPLPREINPKIPEALEEITMHAIEKQKEKRYATAQEFADALKQYLDGKTRRATRRYIYYQKKIWIQKNKDKVLACCIILLFVIVVIINKIGIKTTNNIENIAKENTNNSAKETTNNSAIKVNQNFTKLPYNAGKQYELGKKYYKKQDYTKAIYWYEKAANQGHVEAQVNLGLIYVNGQGVKQDYTKAIYWYEKAANQGHVEAQVNLGLIYHKKDYYDKAHYWYEKAANQGHAEAQYELGYIYYNGQGTYTNNQTAHYWYEKAANQGHAEAQCRLGTMYVNGQGVAQNNQTAVYWYEKAANQGHAEAQYNLGIMYINGAGVKQDYAKTVYWCNKSANQGNINAQNMLGDMYYNGDGGKQDYAKAVYWYEKAANQGNATAQNKLGLMYVNGAGVKQDYTKAREWFEQVVKQENFENKNNLKLMHYRTEQGEILKYTKIVSREEQETSQEIIKAQYNLGNMYYTGQGVQQDYTKARELYEKAAKQGHIPAKLKLKELMNKK